MVISVVNHKGGVGKTFLSVHLATWCVEQGLKTALIDADGNRQSSKWISKAEPSVEVSRIFHPKDTLKTIREAGDMTDVVIIDAAGGDSEVNRMILMRSDMAFVPCSPSEQDLDATIGEIEVLKEIQETRQGLPQAYLVPNMLVPGHRFTQDLLSLEDHPKLIPFTRNRLRLRPPYAEGYPKRTVTWRLTHGYAAHAANEIQALMEEMYGYFTERRACA